MCARTAHRSGTHRLELARVQGVRERRGRGPSPKTSASALRGPGHDRDLKPANVLLMHVYDSTPCTRGHQIEASSRV